MSPLLVAMGDQGMYICDLLVPCPIICPPLKIQVGMALKLHFLPVSWKTFIRTRKWGSIGKDHINLVCMKHDNMEIVVSSRRKH